MLTTPRLLRLALLASCLSLVLLCSGPAGAQGSGEPGEPDESAEAAEQPTGQEPAGEPAGDGETSPAEPTVEPDPLPTPDTATAEALFQLGKALLERGELHEACAKLAASMRAEPAAGTLLNLALCHERQGQLASAWAEYRKAGDMIRAAGQPERADEAMALAVALEPKLSRLTITVAQPVAGLKVSRNGIVIASGAFGVAMPVDPGPQRIEASAPGHERWSVDLEMGQAERRSVAVPALTPSARASAADSASPGPSAGSSDYSVPGIAGIVMLSAGALSVGLGAIFGAVAASDANEAESDPALCGQDKRCTPEGMELIDTARDEALVSTLAIGIGAATLVGGLVLLLSTGDFSSEPADQAAGDTAAVELGPIVGPGGGGLTLTGRF